MFDSSYSFKFLMTQKVDGEAYRAVHRFTFTCKQKRRYAVLLEEYEQDFFSVKFHLRSMEHSGKKYKMLTNFFDAPAVINTCLNIMGYMLSKHERASFGFTGAPLKQKRLANPRSDTAFISVLWKTCFLRSGLCIISCQNQVLIF